MPDSRKHRGPHPNDSKLFDPSTWQMLRTAVGELSWLYDRGYATDSALKLVGDRHQLLDRQRTAVRRSSCTDTQLVARGESCRDLTDTGKVAVDGFNLLTTIEAAMSGGVILHGRDGCYRDMASMHGSYRKVEETRPALLLIGTVLEECQVHSAHWYLDQPVSNSGRLLTMIYGIAEEHGWNWQVDLVPDPDRVLVSLPADSNQVIISADSQVIDGCIAWTNAARRIVDCVDDTWIVPLSDQHTTSSE